MESLVEQPVTCKNCLAVAKEPYIQCTQCEKAESDITLCVQCFRKGAEFDNHKNDHSYMVMRTDFCLFEEGWKANEELNLINAISDCGIGNWQDVSYRLPGKSEKECKSHYLRYYIGNPHPELPAFLERQLSHSVPPQHVVYEGGIDEPPRPLPGTPWCRDMAGYNAARGDFDVEYDHSAEVDIQDLDPILFEEDEKPSLGMELQLAVLDIYRRRLGERHRRKKIIRDHGLISVSKTVMTLSRFRQYIHQDFADALPKFLGIASSLQLDLLLEGLKCQSELKRQIGELMECRECGISKQTSIMTFETLKRRRESQIRQKRSLVVAQKDGDSVKWNILNTNPAQLDSAVPGLRRISVPLNIKGKPGYENLNDTEKEIASQLRLLPEDFLRFKSAFIEECRKLNGLKLVQARSLIKIDVNKIRKIYDYLLSVGLIHCSKK